MSAPTRQELLADIDGLMTSLRIRGDHGGLTWQLVSVRDPLRAEDDDTAWRAAIVICERINRPAWDTEDLAPVFREMLLALPGAIEAMHQVETGEGS